MKIIISLDRKFFEYQLFVDFKAQTQTEIVVYQIIDNVLCLSMRKVSEVVAKEILDMWFATSYQPNETDDACMRIIDEIENTS